MIGDTSLLNYLLPVLIAVGIARRGFHVDEGYMASWAQWFKLRPTSESRAAVRRYLQWSRRARTAGGLVGLLAPTLYLEISTSGSRRPEDVGGWAVTLMLAGYLLGALLAEARIDPPRRRPQDAMAVGGRLGDHLPSYAIGLQRGLAVASMLLAGLGALSIPDARISTLPNATEVAGFGIAAVLIAVVVETLQRRILARSRAAADRVGVAVADAMRTSSLQVLCGAAIALLGNIAGGLFILLAASVAPVRAEPAPAWVSLAAIGFVFLLSSLYFWLYFGKPGGFGIRRGERQGVSA